MFCRSVIALLAIVLSFAPSVMANAQSKSTSFVRSVAMKVCSSQTDLGLVLQLGDANFQVRQNAAERLSIRGVEVWDLLVVATRSPNHEIAATASRIIQQINIQPQLDHPSNVLAGYRQMNFADRARAIIRLGRSFEPDEQKLLAELVRFEEDEFLSRCAAIELITGGDHDRSASSKIVQYSQREAAEWLRIDAEAQSIGHQAWKPIVDALLIRSAKKQLRLDSRRLAQWYVELCLTDGKSAEANRVANRIIESLPVQANQYVEAMDWCLFHRLFDVAQTVVESSKALEQPNANLLWREAELCIQIGNGDKAENLIKLALASYEENPIELLQQAMLLNSVGFGRMAERALETLIGLKEVDEVVQDQARRLLAEMYFEANDLKRAIQTLAITDQDNVAKPSSSGENVSATFKAKNQKPLSSRYCYFTYLEAISRSDWQEARDYLSVVPNPDSDWLIAYSRVPKEVLALTDTGPEQWKAKVDGQINQSLDSRAERIESLRNQFSPDPKKDRVLQVELANELNSFAWLASQTSMRPIEAEAAAREANALHPGSGKMLDTLAACLHSQGRWAEAIAIQRKALVRTPYSSVMRRNLQAYQRAWATAELPGQLPGLMR